MDPLPTSWESAAGFVAEFCALGGTSSRPVLLAGLRRRGSGGPPTRGTARARGRWHDADPKLLAPTPSCVVRRRRPFHCDVVLNGFAFRGPGGLSPGRVDLRGVCSAAMCRRSGARAMARARTLRSVPSRRPGPLCPRPARAAPLHGRRRLPGRSSGSRGAGPRWWRLRAALSGSPSRGPRVRCGSTATAKRSSRCICAASRPGARGYRPLEVVRAFARASAAFSTRAAAPVVRVARVPGGRVRGCLGSRRGSR